MSEVWIRREGLVGSCACAPEMKKNRAATRVKKLDMVSSGGWNERTVVSV
jgi:hypothetical protein